MDPLHLAIALGPLAIYLLLLGAINLSTRPFLTTGLRDTLALGVAVAGFVVAGPMELFLPEVAAAKFGPFVWLLLLMFYGLCLTLLVLLMRPRLVVYNATIDQMQPIIAQVVKDLDPQARKAGDSWSLPTLGVQLHLEQFGLFRNVQLVSTGPVQNLGGWRKLETALAESLGESRGAHNPYGGGGLLIFGVLLLSIIGFYMATDQAGVAQALTDMLRL